MTDKVKFLIVPFVFGAMLVLNIGIAKADVCFLPSNNCGGMVFVPPSNSGDICVGYNETVDRSSETVICEKCPDANRWKCYSDRCLGTDYKYTEQQAIEYRSRGYTCVKCESLDSKNKDKYKCSCEGDSYEYNNLCTNCNGLGYTAQKTATNVCIDQCPISINGIPSLFYRFCCNGAHEVPVKNGSSYSCICEEGYARNSNNVCVSTCKAQGKFDSEAECRSGIDENTTKCVKIGDCWDRQGKTDTCVVGKKECASNEIAVGQVGVTEIGNPCYECRAKTDICPMGKKACASNEVQGSIIAYTELGNPCYECREKCGYPYRQVNYGDTLQSGNLTVPNPMFTSWNQNHENYPSVYMYVQAPNLTVYNKIKKDTAECTDTNPKTYLERCEGTPQELCTGSTKKFVFNGCVSEGYSGAFPVKGATWGDCVTDCSLVDGYNNESECKTATGKECLSAGGCYKTCESQGYYSSEADCKQSNGGLVCEKKTSTNCWQLKSNAFTIKYRASAVLSYGYTPCGPEVGGCLHKQVNFYAFLVDSSNHTLKDISGVQRNELSKSPIQFAPGTYKLCFSHIGDPVGPYDCGMGYPTSLWHVRRVILYRNGGGIFQGCFADQITDDNIQTAYSNSMCEKSTIIGQEISCHEYTFGAGGSYVVDWDVVYPCEGLFYE